MSRRSVTSIPPVVRLASWAALLGAWLGSAALASDPAYLAEMPSVEAVRSAVHGETPLDTLAYQAAVFDALRQILQTRTERPDALADPGNLTPGERAVLESYQQASREIFATPGVDSGDLLSAGYRYSATPNFQDQVAAKFFSPAWLADYAASRARFQRAYASQPDRDGDGPDTSTDTTTDDSGSPGVDDATPSFLDRVIDGPGGETITVRQALVGLVKTLGALAIAVLLAVRLFRRKSRRKSEDDD